MRKNLLFIFAYLCIANVGYTQFTAGNITAIVAAASASNTTASVIELSPSVANVSPVSTVLIDGTSSTTGMRFSGSATSTMYLANSADGTLLCFNGGNSNNTSSNSNTILTRAVGTLNASGTFNIAATYSGTSGKQPRSATSIDNLTWFIGDQSGIYTNNATSADPTGNYRACKAFGSTVYVSASSSTVTQVNTVSAATSGTVTSLPGLGTNSDLQDYYLIQSGSNGSTYDVLYVLSATSNTAGSIEKFSLVSGTWTSNGTYTTSFGGFGLAAQSNATGAYLYLSTGAGSLTANSLMRLTDDSGFNATLSINATNTLTLYTAASGTIIKGVAFAPIVPLAIHLTDISASNNNKQNIVNWNTAHEDHGDYFELMHSADGNEFTTIATIKAKGENSKYSYIDVQPFSGTTYYRLKMIDINGNTNYTKVVAASMNEFASNNLTIAPNPATGNNIHLSFGNNVNGNYELTILNTLGRVITQQTIQLNNTNNVYFTLPQLVSGNVYFIKMSNGTETYFQKFLVK